MFHFTICRLLRQVLNETLRLSVLGPYAARYSDNDIVAGGYHIPANTPIVISLGVSLKNETIWKDTEKQVKNCLYEHVRAGADPGGLLRLNW